MWVKLPRLCPGSTTITRPVRGPTAVGVTCSGRGQEVGHERDPPRWLSEFQSGYHRGDETALVRETAVAEAVTCFGARADDVGARPSVATAAVIATALRTQALDMLRHYPQCETTASAMRPVRTLY